MAELPASVRVGPFDYTVREADVVTGDNWAYIAWESREIQIKASLPPSAKRMALLHETLHAIHQLAGVDDGKHREEHFTTRSAPILLDTLQRNPALVAFLLEAANG